MPSGGVCQDATPTPFTASGLDYGIALRGVSFSVNSTYQ